MTRPPSATNSPWTGPSHPISLHHKGLLSCKRQSRKSRARCFQTAFGLNVFAVPSMRGRGGRGYPLCPFFPRPRGSCLYGVQAGPERGPQKGQLNRRSSCCRYPMSMPLNKLCIIYHGIITSLRLLTKIRVRTDRVRRNQIHGNNGGTLGIPKIKLLCQNCYVLILVLKVQEC